MTAVAQKEDYSLAWSGLADAYMKMEKDDQAEDTLLMAIKHDRENDQARQTLKKLLERRGK